MKYSIITLMLITSSFLSAQNECTINVLVNDSPIYFMELSIDSVIVYHQFEFVYKFELTDFYGSGYFVKTDTNGRILEYGYFRGTNDSFSTDTLSFLDIITDELFQTIYEVSHPQKDGVWYSFNQKTKKVSLLRYREGVLVDELKI